MVVVQAVHHQHHVKEVAVTLSVFLRRQDSAGAQMVPADIPENTLIALQPKAAASTGVTMGRIPAGYRNRTAHLVDIHAVHPRVVHHPEILVRLCHIIRRDILTQPLPYFVKTVHGRFGLKQDELI